VSISFTPVVKSVVHSIAILFPLKLLFLILQKTITTGLNAREMPEFNILILKDFYLSEMFFVVQNTLL